jgi:hypothetical protein
VVQVKAEEVAELDVNTVWVAEPLFVHSLALESYFPMF